MEVCWPLWALKSKAVQGYRCIHTGNTLHNANQRPEWMVKVSKQVQNKHFVGTKMRLVKAGWRDDKE